MTDYSGNTCHLNLLASFEDPQTLWTVLLYRSPISLWPSEIDLVNGLTKKRTTRKTQVPPPSLYHSSVHVAQVIFCAPSLLILNVCSNNIMYPKENKAERKLVYACSRCTYKEDVESGSCVYRNNLITTAGSVLRCVHLPPSTTCA